MHMPLAPALGLSLCTAGFQQMDARQGYCAMDPAQAREQWLPEPAFVINSCAGDAAATEFSARIAEEVHRQWIESGEQSSFQAKLRQLRSPPEDMLVDLRGLAAKVAETEAAQSAAD